MDYKLRWPDIVLSRKIGAEKWEVDRRGSFERQEVPTAGGIMTFEALCDLYNGYYPTKRELKWKLNRHIGEGDEE